MKVRMLFHSRAVSVQPWTPLKEAAKLMRDGGFSCLPVVLHDNLVGIITERDVVDAVVDAVTLSNAKVFDCMNEDPVTISPDDDSAQAAARMLKIGCRHLPVVSDGKLVGIVSARDLLTLVAQVEPGGHSALRTEPAEWPFEPPPDVDSER